MPVITFASSKGGPGKTTSAAALASFWAQNGRRVVLVDADPTRALSRWHSRGQQNSTPLEGMRLYECIDEEKILDTIRGAQQETDFVLVDCAGAAGRLLVYAAGAADMVIIPAQPGEADLVEAIKTAKIVRQARELTGRAIACQVFLTRIDPRTHVGKHAIAQAKAQGLPLFATTWADRVAFREGQYSGSTPYLDAPTSSAGKEVEALAREIESALGRKAVVQQSSNAGVQ